MTTGSSSSSTVTSTPTAGQLVFAVTNVYSQFSFKLSIDGSKYKLWRRIFLDMCKGAKVHGHNTGKYQPQGDDDEDWAAIDSRIKSWFYSTCDANLLQIISSDNCTSKDLWDKLDEFFLNNKMSRMLQLQEQFRNTKKGASSITEFCHSLKNLAEELADCDSKIDEVELVMQILRQLPPSYHSIVDVITNTKPFPSFLEAKNMLLIHESREETTDLSTDVPLSSMAALYSSTSSNGKSKTKFNKGNTNVSTSSPNFSGSHGAPPQFQAYFGAQNLIGPQSHQQLGLLGPPPPHAAAAGQFRQPPAVGQQQLSSAALGLGYQPQNGSHLPSLQQPYNAVPLPAYGHPQQLTSAPVQPPYAPVLSSHSFAPQQPNMTSFGGHATQFGQQNYTDLASVFQAMSVQPPQDNNYYMDSGASSHMTFNQGS